MPEYILALLVSVIVMFLAVVILLCVEARQSQKRYWQRRTHSPRFIDEGHGG